MGHKCSKNDWIKLNAGLMKTGEPKVFQSSRTSTNPCDLVFNLFSNHVVFKPQKAENLILTAMFALVVQALKMNIIIHSSASLPVPLIYFWFVSKLFTFFSHRFRILSATYTTMIQLFWNWVLLKGYDQILYCLDSFSLEVQSLILTRLIS